MGHLINPSGFRVGYFSNWIDCWATSNNILYAEILHTTVELKFILNFFLDNVTVEEHGLLYSHNTFSLSTNVGNEMTFKFYFYDGVLEQEIQNFALILKSHKEFIRKRVKRVKRRLGYLHRQFGFNGKVTKKAAILLKARFFDYLVARNVVYLFIYLLNYKRKRFFKLKFAFKLLRKFFKRKWISALKIKADLSTYAFIKFFLKFFIIAYFRKKTRKITKKGFNCGGDLSFFLEALQGFLDFWSTRFTFFKLLLNRRLLSWRFRYVKFFSALNSSLNCVLGFFSYFFRSLVSFTRQSVFFRFINALVLPVVKKSSFPFVSLSYFGLDNDSITASFLSRYIARKLEMRFRINELFKPIGRELRFVIKARGFLLGYKIQFVGRLTRRDRSRKVWSVFGGMPLNSVTKRVEHSLYIGVLRNGVCSLRVWLYRPNCFDGVVESSYKVKTWQ